MYNVLIIDNIHTEALKIAEILSEPSMNCTVMDIVPVGFLGGQRFLRRKPDIVFLDTNLCAMRIDEFLTLAKQAAHSYSIVLLTGEGYAAAELPGFCFTIDKAQLSSQSVRRVLGEIGDYNSGVISAEPPKTDRELLESMLGESGYSVKRALAEQMELPAPFNLIRPALIEFRTNVEFFGIMETLDKMLQHGGAGKLIPLGGQQAAVLLSGREIISQERLAGLLKTHVNTSWAMLEGAEIRLDSLPLEMRRLRSLSRMLYFYPNGSCVSAEQTPEVCELGAEYVREWANRVLRQLLRFKRQAVRESVDEIYLSRLAESRSVKSLQMVRLYVTETLYALFGLARDESGPQRRVWPASRFASIEEEHKHVLREYELGLDKLCERLDAVSAIVRGAAECIYANIYSPISLQAVAAEINVSKEYLCSAFSREMGVGMVEFINGAKVRLACYMLGAGYTTKEIATELGFADSRYFERVFKKLRGITPAQYSKSRDEYREPYAALGSVEESEGA